jgi:hypothetical protein
MNAEQKARKMRYRTFVVLSSIGFTAVGLVCTALVWWDDATNPYVGWLVIFFLGIGLLNAVSLLLAWRTNRATVERWGFRRW